MDSWSSDFSVGIPEMDEQHQQLFSALDNFYEGLKQGAAKEQLSKLIDKLIEYARLHFAHEERIMQLAGYPGLANHRKEHLEFIETATRFSDKFKGSKLVISIEVTAFIKDWIINHILIEDKKYGEYIK